LKHRVIEGVEIIVQGDHMRILQLLLLPLFVIAGALLALHGLDVLPGASPEAQPRYAAAGVAMIVGGALLAWPRRRRLTRRSLWAWSRKHYNALWEGGTDRGGCSHSDRRR
jgi:hypothetical protein